MLRTTGAYEQTPVETERKEARGDVAAASRRASHPGADFEERNTLRTAHADTPMRETTPERRPSVDSSPLAGPNAPDAAPVPAPRDAGPGEPPTVDKPHVPHPPSAAKRPAGPVIATQGPRHTQAPRMGQGMGQGMTQGPRLTQGQGMTQAPGMTQGPRPTQIPRVTQAPPGMTAGPTEAQRGTGGAPLGGDLPRRATRKDTHPLSLVGGVVRRTLHGASKRQEQRRRLIVVLAGAELALALAAAPGYVVPQVDLVGVAVVAAAALVSLLSLGLVRMLHGVGAAAYLLVGGSVLVTAAHLALAGLAGDPFSTAQAALFFLPLIVAAGVLFTAEITIGLVALTLTLTAAALLFSLTQAKVVPGNEIYLAVIYSMSLQALAGMVAWLVAQFLFESAVEAQLEVRLHMAERQRDALQSKQLEQQRRLHTEVQALQDAITQIVSGGYVDRVNVVPEELGTLIQSFNLLLGHIHSLTTSGSGGGETNGLIGQMLAVIGEIAEGNASTPRALPAAVAGPLPTVLHALIQLQAQSGRRYGQLAELAGEIAGAVQTGIDGLGKTADDIRDATAMAGKVLAIVDQLALAAANSHALVLHARDTVGRLLPPAVLHAAAQDALHRDASGLTPDEAAKLLGHTNDLAGLDVLDVDATGEFDILEPAEPGEGSAHDIPPLTIPLPIVELDDEGMEEGMEEGMGAGDPNGGVMAGTMAEGEMQAQLLELWRMLDRLATTLGREHRTLKSVLRELGKLSRSARDADAGLAHGDASLAAARSAIKHLQQTVRPARAPGYTGRPMPAAGPLANSADSRPRPVDTAELMEFGGAASGPSRSGSGSRSSAGWNAAPDVVEAPGAPEGDAEYGSFDLRELIDADLLTGSSPHAAGSRPADEDDPA